ncbi:chemotaxis protein CheC [Geomobilimonas luticola]|uniref:Chemotaxis protein CheC n=1 Tax=Geomobilimonas luticola TaxID=1114878 RepID=A0ABS5SBV5_9BACT|nr:chemotaxis protein CheC [Geomobilimonas luticola]MBT0651507.1 chemotaxis protein CheC [Geomobilimonas luticola]
MRIANLSEAQIDALREVSNIGMGHAATALSQLLGKTVHLQVPQVLITDISKVPELLGGAEKMVVGIYLQVLGSARGNILMIFRRENAIRMLDKLLSRDNTKGGLLSELEVSALKEVGNILASAYLNALGSMLKMTLIPSVPVLSFDMAGAVVDYVLVDLAADGDLSLMVETEFFEEGEQVKGHFFLLPDPPSLQVILKSIGVIHG